MTNTANDTRNRLRQLTDYPSLIDLLVDLGYDHADEPRSTVGWPEQVRAAVSDLRVAAKHGQFAVFYAVVSKDRMLSWERQVVSRVLSSDPHSLFVFADPQGTVWHFVHVRYDEQAERRRQLRRFVVDRLDLQGGQTVERLRTTAERLTKLGIAPGERLTVAQVQDRCDEAFRISEISDSFLKLFVTVVGRLTSALLDANPTLLKTDAIALEQAQLLMDRLVFLYFIQKKQWLNGEPDYLYSRFRRAYQESPTSDSFYQQRLIPLFRALSHRDAPRPGDEALPFLNGGLFDLPLSHGTANPPTDEVIRVTNEALFPVFADFLERYNFTVTEDSPLDIEVAVNPEVIGTIFETFVLRAENDAGVNAPDRRKATGSYYTPRVVVHFICRAVLRRYLAERTGIDDSTVKQLIEYDPADQLDDRQTEQLRTLVTVEQAEALRREALRMRACDPAVGSGAFPVGLLQEMVKLISLLDVRVGGRNAIARPNYAYNLKKQIIETCLYGVDIQDQAARICELRLWLSLVVDYQVDNALPLRERIDQVRPLPNLTFRIRVGDSLLDQLFGHDWEVNTSLYGELIERIRGLKLAYFASESPEGKRDLERQVLGLQIELLEQVLRNQRLDIGATLPLMSDLQTAKQDKELAATKARLAEIDDLLARASQAKAMAAVPTRDAVEHARRFDAMRQHLGVSFVWGLDFAEVFDARHAREENRAPGFDVIVGNPPFVTARDPDKRERYRKRWPTSTYKKYHLLAPFVELALVKLLRPQGQLGYIVSNAFATRDFGEPLVERVLTRMELLNVVDCSGLMFPGHGTPTCVLLGHAISGVGKALKPGEVEFSEGKPKLPTLLCGTRPGMGQLTDEPEETALWREVEVGWERDGFKGARMVTTGWEERVARTHPWSFDAGGINVKTAIEAAGPAIRGLLSDDVGWATVTASDEVFDRDSSHWRRVAVRPAWLHLYVEGPEIRDWSACLDRVLFAPYDEEFRLAKLSLMDSNTRQYLEHFRGHLAKRKSFQSKTFEELGRPWYEFERWNERKYRANPRLIMPFIATHVHVTPPDAHWALNRHSEVVSVKLETDALVVLASVNSPPGLFWLKQVCFCKRYSANPETDDYYEFAGGKVEQLPVPDALLKSGALRKRAEAFAERCSALGVEIPGLHPRKLFEREGDAYADWYREIRGYQKAHPTLRQGWNTSGELKSAWADAIDRMQSLRRQMVALQEEMDWLIYAAYGFLPATDHAVNLNGPAQPTPIDQLDRPYRLLQHDRPVPKAWPASQKALWRRRLELIGADPNIRQIEQPAYKRRWVEPFDDGDFIDAYEWWLREKAEWVLEHRHAGGPIALDAWAKELLDDPSVRAAYGAALDIGAKPANAVYARERDRADFTAHLKRIVEEETVPDDRSAFKAKHVKLRGIDDKRHLPNGVPRERFRSVASRPGWYVWAGKDIWGGVKGDEWDA